jgi:DNA-binding transcriptional ArsR family regulator
MSNDMDAFTDLERFRLPPTPTEVRCETKRIVKPSPVKTKKIKGEFLKGPIPLGWLACAAKLSGKAPVAVALAIWFQAGRRRSKEVRLTTAVIERFGIDRKAKYRGLSALEKAGLVRVHRQPRRNPVVTILDWPDQPLAVDDDREVTDMATAETTCSATSTSTSGGT